MEELTGDLIKQYRQGKSGLEVRGRGEWHQIDALGQFEFPPPFTYPVRLLCEAKCYSRKKVDLPVVRNFVGVLKDIAENYFVTNLMNPKYVDRHLRFTDCGAIFSITGFTNPAENYAWAHGVKLISYEGIPQFQELGNIITQLIDSINEINVKEEHNLSKFCKAIYAYLSNGFYPETDKLYKFFDVNGMEALRNLKRTINNINAAPIGLAAGGFPVHIISEQPFPEEIFQSTDEVLCTLSRSVYASYFIIRFPRYKEMWEGYFSVPTFMLENYLETQQLLKFKERFLNYIDVPWVINRNLSRICRILRLKLDKEWLEAIRNKKKN